MTVNTTGIQIEPDVKDSPHESLGKEILLIQGFLIEHQSEVSVGVYDLTIFRAIDQRASVCRKPTKTWKRSRTSCPTRKSK